MDYGYGIIKPLLYYKNPITGGIFYKIRKYLPIKTNQFLRIASSINATIIL